MNFEERKAWYSTTTQRLCQKFNVELEFLYSNRVDILPFVKNNQIFFSQKLDTLFLLQNLYFFCSKGSIAQLSVDYLLAIRLVEYNYYDPARKFLKDLSGELGQLKDSSLFTEASLNRFEVFREFQCTFVIFHEFFHHLFKNNAAYRQEGLSQARQAIQDVHNAYTVSRLNIIKKALYHALNYQQHIAEILDDSDKVEEFACDLYAWNILLKIVQGGGFSEDEIYWMCIACIVALHHVDEIKLTDDILTHKSYEYDPIVPRTLTLFSRVNILEYSIRYYIYSEMPQYKEDFESTLSEYEAKGRSRWIIDSCRSFKEGRVLLEGAEIGEPHQREALLNEIDRIEQEIYQMF